MRRRCDTLDDRYFPEVRVRLKILRQLYKHARLRFSYNFDARITDSIQTHPCFGAHFKTILHDVPPQGQLFGALPPAGAAPALSLQQHDGTAACTIHPTF